LAPEIPAWVTDPSKLREKVLGIVLGALVGGMGVALDAVTKGIWTPIDSALGAFGMAGNAVDSSLASVAGAIFDAEMAVTGALVGLGANSGLAAPLAIGVIVAGMFGVVFVVVFVFVQVVRLVNPQ
jgi:hypothetical protein